MTEKILVFIPCYNCELQIPRVLRQFDAGVGSWFSEILILDNGSKDNTVSAAINATRGLDAVKVTIGKNQANYNLGGSHKAAFGYAVKNGFTHVVVLHGDDQGNIRDLLPLLESGKHRSMDACLGARFAAGSKLVGYSKFRIFGNYVFNTFFTLGTGKKVHDLGSGLNIFGERVISDKDIVRYADDLRFNIYLLLGLFRKKLNTLFFPISWREDDQVSNVKMTSQALKTLQLLVQSILNSTSFESTDHRSVKHETYTFDVVHRHD